MSNKHVHSPRVSFCCARCNQYRIRTLFATSRVSCKHRHFSHTPSVAHDIWCHTRADPHPAPSRSCFGPVVSQAHLSIHNAAQNEISCCLAIPQGTQTSSCQCFFMRLPPTPFLRAAAHTPARPSGACHAHRCSRPPQQSLSTRRLALAAPAAGGGACCCRPVAAHVGGVDPLQVAAVGERHAAGGAGGVLMLVDVQSQVGLCGT